MTRWRLLGGLLVVLCASMVLAKPGVVKMKDGRSIEGDVTDKGADGVTIVTKGGTLSLPQSDVASIIYAINVQEQYQQRLAALPKDAGGAAHVELARWLYENKAYELARKEIETALAIEPNSAEAGVLKQTIDRAMIWEKGRSNTTPTTPGPKTPGTVKPPVNPAARKDRKLLDADQINTIRQCELRDNERITIRVEPDVVKKYLAQSGKNPKDFAKQNLYQQAMEILKSGGADLRPGVKVTNDPQALAGFKRVQPAILMGCASIACHGGANAGTFILHGPANSDPVTYTNFYILTQYVVKTPDGDRKLIIRTLPEKSLLIQYGLPRDVAEAKHPDVTGFTSMFRNTQDQKYIQMLAWIRDGLGAMDKDYGIDFPVQPNTSTATPPVTQPTTEPPKAQPTTENPTQPPPAEPKKDDAAAKLEEDRQRQLQDARDRAKSTPIQIPPPVLPF